MNAITYPHTPNVTFLTLHCRLNSCKKIYLRTHFRAESTLQELPRFKTQNWGRGRLIKYIKKFVLVFYFYCCGLISAFLLCIVLTQRTIAPPCAAPHKPLTLSEKPTLNATVLADLPRTEYCSGRHDCFAYTPWAWASQVRELRLHNKSVQPWRLPPLLPLWPNLGAHLSSGAWTRARSNYELVSPPLWFPQAEWSAIYLQVTTGAASS